MRIRTLILPFALTASIASCATNPVTGQRELSLVSESQEVQMGQQGAQEVVQSMGLVPDSALQQYVRALGMQIAQRSERPNLPWSFAVVDDPVVNAFALPGGPVFITRGLLTYMTSEGELMSVLGHEAGHITAKHSVRQISRAQLAQISLVAGSVLSEQVAQFGDVIGQGLGLLFLKYGREDETQADDLGFRYMVENGYDAREMAEMFRTLERVSGTSKEGRPPEWLSSHPDPGNRVQRTLQKLSAAPQTGTKVERDAFMRRINGLVFGENPRQGFFEGMSFLHPDLRFQFDFPQGWKAQNQVQAVVGISPQQDALVTLTIAGRGSPQQLASQFFGQQGMQVGESTTRDINGLPAAWATFTAQTEQGQLAGVGAFISLDGMTYRLLGYTPAQKFSAYSAALQRVVTSFRRLTDPRALGIQPARVAVVQIPRAMTLAEFQQQYPSAIPLAQLAIINGVEGSATLPAGTLLKRVVDGH